MESDTPKPTGARDGIVSGTAADDRIDAAYTGDPDGDMIDNSDAIIPGEAPEDDIVMAGGGNDFVTSLQGDDEVHGGDGNDTLRGGDGDDLLKGQGGDDLLKGEAGDDTLLGGVGSDTLNGGADADMLDAGDGDDVLQGETGNDTLIGGAGNDTLQGDAGDDDLSGGDGNDILLGGGGGIDALKGGADRDLIFAEAGDDVDGGAAGDDFDTLDITGQGPYVVRDQRPDSNGNGFDGTIVFLNDDGSESDRTIEFVEIEKIIGDPPNANLPPRAVDDDATTPEDTAVTVDVLGNDSDPEGQPLTVTGATSPDGTVDINPDGTLTFTPAENFNGDTTIVYEIDDGNGGTDTGEVAVSVTPVNDDPVANPDSSTTAAATAVTADVLANDTDVDGDTLTITGATSPDGTVVDNGDGTLTFTPADGFSGDATVSYDISDGNGGTDTGTWTVSVGPAPDRDGIVFGTDGDDLIDTAYDGDPDGDFVDNEDAILDGEAPNDDIIRAGDGDDTVRAGEGDDEITGGNGSDDVDGGPGDDLIDTGNGEIRPDIGYPGLYPADTDPEDDRDLVAGGDGNDTISTGDDRDTISGGNGNDVIDAGIDDDVVRGDDGDDRIVGGEGSDLLLGGNGDDTIYAGNDPDRIPDAVNIEDDGSNPFGPDLRPENGRDTVDGGAGNDVIFGADDDDVLSGGSGNDFLDGQTDDDTLSGGTGEDTLIGGQGDDSLSGGLGDDVLDGGIGNDTLRGNRDDDLLSGGAGDDLLDGGGQNDILNGDAGNDTLQGATGDDTLNGGDGDDVVRGGQGNDLIDGGDGIDDLAGGNDRDTFVNVNAGDVVNGNEGGDDFDTLDLTGSAPDGGRLEIDYDDDNDENGTVSYFNADNTDAGTLRFTNIENVIPCFTPGTLIATPKGERRVEDLVVGDRVITRDNGIQDIRWVGARAMTGAELERAAHLKPVLIQQGALGNGLPERDMLVSPNHRVLVANDKTALYFEEREVLVAAKHLTGLDGVDIVDVSGTTYIHIMFDQHEVVLSDGTWTESFQPGDNSLAGIGNAQRTEIFELFPELSTREGIDSYQSARRSLKKHEARLLTK